tara:strand:+ start:3269 stop:3862 length:594 start_codon:yes stop_codon:yes gene_type:complete
MKFAYADPPYLGRAEYYTAHHPDAKIWDDPEAHRSLIYRLQDEYSDGWAMSLSEQSLRTILPMCPAGARVAAWIADRPRFAGKPVAVRRHFEPVIFMGGRGWSDTGNRTADFVITAQQPTNEPRYVMDKSAIRAGKIFVGRKPHAFGIWIMDLLGVRPGDTVDDLFPGSGAVGHAIAQRLAMQPEPFGLFERCHQND